MVTDRDALECDLAETYGIYDMESLPVIKVATFAIGLKGDSRIMKKITGQLVDMPLVLLAGILDRLSFLVWAKTKDAQSGRNRPVSVLNALYAKKPEREHEVFDTGADLMSRLKELREE